MGGRCYEDLNRLEDEFSSVLGIPGGSPGTDRPVSLRVRAIPLYGRYMNQLDPGLTAELELKVLSGTAPRQAEWVSGALRHQHRTSSQGGGSRGG